MKLAALTRVKIDGDIIEEFVRHTLQFVDELLVVDNVSPDDTLEILYALQDEGLPVSVFEDEHVEVLAHLTTGYAREAFERTGADYLLVLDADEFLRASSRAALEAALAALPAGAHGLMPWRTYVPLGERDAERGNTGDDDSVLSRFPYRLVHENPQFHKAIVARSFLKTPGATIIPGNHAVEFPDGTRMSSALLSGVELAHIPVRSLPQIQAKALLGWSAYIAAGLELENSLAVQWRRTFESLIDNPHSRDGELFKSASMYFGAQTGAEVVHDPLPPVTRRFPQRAWSLIEIAIEYIRQLTRAHAQLVAENKALKEQLAARADEASLAGRAQPKARGRRRAAGE